MSPSSRESGKDPEQNLKAAKDRVFARLANLDWVSGVGISDSKLAVYTTRPLKQDESQHVKSIVSSEAPGHDVDLVETGAFKKQ